MEEEMKVIVEQLKEELGDDDIVYGAISTLDALIITLKHRSDITAYLTVLREHMIESM